MSAGNAVVMPAGVPFRSGHDPRRLAGPRISPAERELRALIESEQIPKANAALTRLMTRGMDLLLSDSANDVIAGKACLDSWFKICGLIQKPTDNAVIHETAKAIVGEMIAEARARRAEP